MINPEIKKRIPANCRGVEYFKPILMAVNGVAQSKQAKIARTLVENRNFFMKAKILCKLRNFIFTERQMCELLVVLENMEGKNPHQILV